jgi:outer membrane protein OmpA-like peptidoglycan-associated protein
MEDVMKKLSILKALVVLVSLCLTSQALATSALAQDPVSSGDSDSRMMQVGSAVKMKVRGVILRREDPSSFILRSDMGSDVKVGFAGTTKIEEKKSNPFRGSKKYAAPQLLPGLNVEVEGRGDGTGALAAEKIKFSEGDLKMAVTVNSQVVPIERRLGTTENRLSRTEQNAERLSGQLEELHQVANLAKGGAAHAQDTADAAVDAVNKTNDRIGSLDDYEVRTSKTVNFKVGSAFLSPDSKMALDEIATQAKSERGFVIEVRGFASSDGSENLNRQLSQRRADAVIRYLAEQHDIPLRRIILPFGYGEAQPVAENTSREGRQQNRRVEVKILISRGLTTPVNVNRPVSAN